MKYLFVILAFAYSSQNNAQSQFIDTSFGTNSGYTINQMATDDFAFSSVIELNNAIYAMHSKLGGQSYLSKYDLNGIIDSNFGINGFISINTVGLTDFSLFTGVKTLSASSDGKLLITSSARAVTAGQVPDAIVIKLNLDGSHDTNYGINGQVLTNFTFGQTLIGNYKYPQDELILVFNKQNQQINATELTLLKINATGNFDSNFGVNGKITLPADYSGYYPKLAKIHNESAYIYFYSSAQSDYIKKFDLTSLNYDLTFGVNGVLNIEDAYSMQESISFIIDENDDIFVVGYSTNQNNNVQINVLKFTNELLDISFGTNGVSQNIIANSISGVYSIEKYSDKIVILGENYSTTNPEGATFLAQLNLNGTLDPNFGENGVIINETFGDLNMAFDYIYSEDSIITGGLCPIGDGEYRPCLTKYYTNNNLGSTSLDQNNFAFYPNPVTSELHFQTTEDVIKIVVYDILGRVVKLDIVSQNKTDLSEITSGTYIIKAQTRNKTQTFKLIKA